MGDQDSEIFAASSWPHYLFSYVRTLLQEEEHAHEVHCSRERSRAAWKIIEEYLMPFVKKERYEISTKCRLHPDNDLFRGQERNKIHLDINEWQCGYCKKSFRAEKFLDQHLDNRHYNLLNVSGSKCLADLCGALHCDTGLANSCFPSDQGPSAHRLNETSACILPGYFHTDSDVASYFLCDPLFTPKRDEKGNPRAQAHTKSWAKKETLIVGYKSGLVEQIKDCVPQLTLEHNLF
ncbi:hypothetical protein ACLB2K_043980 [Fragaria x ananassa]